MLNFKKYWDDVQLILNKIWNILICNVNISLQLMNNILISYAQIQYFWSWLSIIDSMTMIYIINNTMTYYYHILQEWQIQFLNVTIGETSWCINWIAIEILERKDSCIVLWEWVWCMTAGC